MSLGKKIKRWAFWGVLTVVASVALFIVVFALSACQAMGKAASGKRLAKMEASSQWKDGAFTNPLPRVQAGVVEMVSARSDPVEGRVPANPQGILKRKGSEFSTPPASGLRVTWLGHSTLLLEIDGQRVLIDPVWGERASPVGWAGPERFHPPPLPLEELPAIDAVVISHDHYDHLDLDTVTQMLNVDTKWLVPLGIGAHLEYWGMPKDRIVEMDWWDETTVGGLTLTCTPARHFSGRSLNQNSTLWAGWAFKGPTHRAFYSGDTALHPTFAEIGERLGPFDVTMMETGASDPMWTDVHLGPEQAVMAHQLVKGKVMLPVHWGTFNLGNHGWTQPIQRVLAAAKKVDVIVAAPRPGGSIEPSNGAMVDPWWDTELEWKTVAERPVWSTSVDALLKASPLYVPKAEAAAK